MKSFRPVFETFVQSQRREGLTVGTESENLFVSARQEWVGERNHRPFAHMNKSGLTFVLDQVTGEAIGASSILEAKTGIAGVREDGILIERINSEPGTGGHARSLNKERQIRRASSETIGNFIASGEFRFRSGRRWEMGRHHVDSDG
jgi:hypothetical protein